MSSTVTTTTISTVTTAASFAELGQAMSMVAILLLVVVLLAREISSASKGSTGRRVARGLDITLVPLMVAFGLVIWLNSGTFLG